MKNKYSIKLVFHLPEFFIDGNNLLKCDNYSFRRELVDALHNSGAGYFFSVPAKTFFRGREFCCEHLVVYTTEDSYYGYVKTFLDLVCGYHSSLRQDAYYYEQDDTLVKVHIGEG